MYEKRCKICGRMVTLEHYFVWINQGKLFKGCRYCYMVQKEKTTHGVKPVREDDIL